MPYTRREYYTTNKDIQRYFDKLVHESITEIPSNIASEISRHKTIRTIRDMNHQNPYLLFGHDDKFHKTIIQLKRPMRLRKNGNRYEFFLE